MSCLLLSSVAALWSYNNCNWLRPESDRSVISDTPPDGGVSRTYRRDGREGYAHEPHTPG